MNGFLYNMIARHQGLVATVQPRQRALFEPESAGAESLSTSADSAAAAYSPTPATERNAMPGINERPKPSLASLPPQAAPIVTAASPDFEPIDERPLPALDLRLQDILQRLPAAPRHEPSAKHPESRRVADAGAQNILRLEEMIARLASRSAAQAGVSAPDESDTRSSPTAPSAIFEPPATALSLHTSSRIDSGERLEITDRSPLPVASPEPQGTLQIPDWLHDLQKSFSQRIQASDAAPTPEPVINVTIGRIEIRATQNAAAQPPARPNKPSGLMSLDDYLQQRRARSGT